MASENLQFDYQACARRMWGVYRREKTDRIPITSPLPWGPTHDIDSVEFGDWRDEERFRRVARLVQKYCDPKPPYNRVGFPHIFAPQSYQRFLEAPQEYIEELPVEQVSKIRTRHVTLLHTPKRDLRWVVEKDKDIFTDWDIEKPVKTIEDAEALLSVPCPFIKPDPSEFAAFRAHRAEMGRYAIGGGGVNSMVAMLVGIMDYELLLEWMMTEPETVKLLADTWLERVGERVDYLLKQGVGPFWHFNGVERAAPPMMGPKQWKKWVEPYDGEIMRRIKAADPQARIHVHCHGRMRTLLDSFVSMGVDSTDPVEPAPQGDADIAEVKRIYDGKMVFVGNIEFLWMETAQPGEMEAQVKRAIEASGKRNLILMTSAGPHERPSDLCLANAERYIEAGLKYGEM